MAEYFNGIPIKKMSCSLLDNIFRLVQSRLRKYPRLLGRMPSAVGYQPTLASVKLGRLKNGFHKRPMVLLRLFQAVYVPADDITDPAPAATFPHLDASTVLSKKTCRS